jgi:uncharacterized protein
MRYVVLILLVVLAVWLVRRALRGGAANSGVRKHAESQGELVRCAHCGVHLPRSEARLEGGTPFCSAEHARLGRR